MHNQIKTGFRLVLMMLVFIFCCSLTACQPTPESPVIVNRQEDIPQDSIINSPQSKEEKADESDWIMPMDYTATEHWTESFAKSEALTIEVDADVLMPDVNVYPVDRLEPYILTPEKVNEFIEFFTQPGTKFFTGDKVRLKSEYAEDIVQMKASLQQVLNGGDGEDPNAIRSYIKETEEKMAKAPESYTYTYVEPVFTYPTDGETGEPIKSRGENDIYVSLEWPDGSRNGYIVASRYESGKSTDAGFGFSTFSGGYEQESYFIWLNEQLDEQEANRPLWANKSWQDDIDRQRKYANDGQQRMETNNMDVDAAVQKAIELLNELGIQDMQLKKSEKILYSLELSGDYKEGSYTEPACRISFMRHCGGIPAGDWTGGGGSSTLDYSELYCSPYYMEEISVIVSDGGIESFSWNSMVQVVERTAQNTNLLPLAEIKKRLTDHIYFMRSYHEGNPAESRTRVNITGLKLCMTYVNAKDDPERVLAVPVWQATTREEYWNKDTDKWWPGNQENVFINALDGGAILLPGIVARMREMQETG